MSVEKSRKRRIELLKKLAAKAKWRHDVRIPLEECSGGVLQIHTFGRTWRFVDKSNPKFEGGSELAYDFNTLVDEGLLKAEATGESCHDDTGELVVAGHVVQMTAEGLIAVGEANKSWLQKAIDKQPITFLQIVVTVLFTIGGWVGGFAVGRYWTPPVPAGEKREVVPEKVVEGSKPAGGEAKEGK